MSVSAINRRQYEDRESGTSVPTLVLCALVLFTLAILLMYICVATPVDGTSMGAIRNVMCGLGGSLRFALPLILAWAGVLCVGAARGKGVSPVRVTLDALLILCLFTAVQLFFVERIKHDYMTLSTFSNFVTKSYGFGKGGGAIGALLAWPLYNSLGVGGGFITTLLVSVVLLTATGRVGTAVRWFRDRAENAPVERTKIEREFDKIEAAPRRRAARDAYAEPAQAARGAARSRQQAGQRMQTAAPRRTDARRPLRDPSADEAFGSRPARAVNQPARKRAPAAAVPMEAAAPARRKPAASAAQQAQPAKRKKLYNEKIVTEQKPAVDQNDAPVEALFDAADDFDVPTAGLLKNEKADKKAVRSTFKPDRPSMMRNAEIVDIPDAEPEAVQAVKPEAKIAPVKADKKSNISIDDLKIQPEAYELPDEDEAPFDIPGEKPKAAAKAGIAAKADTSAKVMEFPKLKRAKEAQPVEDVPEYNYPPIDLLARGEVEDTTSHGQRDIQKAQLLEDTLQSFGISAKLTGIAHGPAVTRFELQPAPGVKVSRITALADDIALNLAAMSVRIEAPIPGKAAVGVEIPNDKVEMVRLRDVLESSEAQRHPSRIAVGLGKDNSGRYIVADIAKMPHVLIAGQTGSGKSVCINAIITSILFRSSPEEVKLILIDPKMVELSIYNNIPHLVCPVVTDPKKAASALDWAVAEMTKRYKLFAESGVRDIKGYNKKLKPGEKPMPQMVIIIDELADLMMVSPGEVEDSICRLAQLARACGMHLVIATQRPSVNVITGIIKANIPTRIAFSVASQVDSRTMIDHGGAEKLLGNGDMLFVPNGMKSMRVQGAWVSDDEVHAIVEYIKQSGEAVYDPDMLEHLENANRSDAEKEEFEAEYDPKLPEAVDIALDMGQVSISMLQRKMRIGYARAGRIIDEMARRGIVSEADGSKPRVVLITREQAQQMFEE